MKQLLILPAAVCVLVGAAHAQESSHKQPPVKPVVASRPEAPIGQAEGFVIVRWDQAGDYIGQHALVYGRVIATYKGRYQCYLNFNEDIEHTFTVSIDRSAYDEFPGSPEILFREHMVVARGRINDERGKPEVTVTQAADVVLIPDQTQDVIPFIKKTFRGSLTPDQLQTNRRPARSGGQLTIGTYNVLNLFDELDDPYHADEVMRTKPREELEKVAARIRQLDADVLALQEVENRFYLEKFVRALLADMGYEHIALIEGNNDRGIDVAVISRYPIGPVTSYRNLRFDGPDGKVHCFQRDLLKVHVYGPGDFEFDLFAVHLKSKYGGAEASEPIRQAEATKIRQIIDAVLYDNPHARFVICGDFNDTWDSPSLQLIRGAGQTELTSPAASLPEEQAITYNKEPHRSMIDFILCSPEMSRLCIAEQFRIIQGTVEDSGSDHNPVVATFKVR